MEDKMSNYTEGLKAKLSSQSEEYVEFQRDVAQLNKEQESILVSMKRQESTLLKEVLNAKDGETGKSQYSNVQQ